MARDIENTTDSIDGDGNGGAIEVALLDRGGVIVFVNAAWRKFARENGGDAARTSVGSSFLAISELGGDQVSQRIAASVRNAISGRVVPSESIRLNCPIGTVDRWYDIFISSRFDDEGHCIGATVAYSPIDFGSGRRHSDVPASVASKRLEALKETLHSQAEELFRARERLGSSAAQTTSVAARIISYETLQKVVATACGLVEAEYGACTLLDERQRVSDFLFSGVEDEKALSIGLTPQGLGVLAPQAPFDRVVRLSDLTTSDKFSGFPTHHPEMRAFMGIPLHVRGALSGHLFVAEKTGGAEFSTDDETILRGLAFAANEVLSNAKILHDIADDDLWRDADELIDLMTLADNHSPGVIRMTLATIRRVIDADHVSVARRHPGTGFTETIDCLGPDLEPAAAAEVSIHTMISENAVRIGSFRSENAPTDQRLSFARHIGSIGSFIAVSITADDEPIGAMVASRSSGRTSFTAAEREVFGQLSKHTALALELARTIP